MEFVDVSQLPTLFEDLQKKFLTGKTRSYQWRVDMLKKLKELMRDPLLKDAAQKDLKQSDFLLSANFSCIEAEINDSLANLSSWMKPEKKPVNAMAAPASGYVVRDPLGVVLIIGAWNFPVELIVRPLIGAIAAGNCVVVKPSEVAEGSSCAMAKLFPKYLGTEFIKVVEGGVTETTALLKLPWNHIFYTGNPQVGKIIMRAASDHLTPVTLELGGKNPVFVDEHANIPIAAKRIMWGKFTSCGQICLAPDYLLVHRKVADKFKKECIKTIKNFYGDNPQQSDVYARMINKRHTRRVIDTIQSISGNEKIICGGQHDESDCYVAPTLVENVTFDSNLMHDELFGPVLPIIEYENIDHVINYVNSRDRPLCISVFSDNKKTKEKVINSTCSGSCLFNELLLVFTCYDLPFGGVNTSGIGKYGGKLTFELFSNAKAVLDQSTMLDLPVRYPPYSQAKVSFAKMAATFKVDLTKLWVLVVPIVAIAISWVYAHNML